MSQPSSISFDDVLALLRGPVVQEFEAAYAASRDCTVTQTWGDSQKLTRELAFAQISRVAIEQMLVVHRDLIGRFVDGLAVTADDEEDRPEGEEPDDQPQVVPSAEPISMMRGFSIWAACSVWFLLERKDAELVQWLKFRRIPQHRKYAQDLRKILDRCTA